ncbi:MAG: YeeE/YedE thiosulfate transporter family protein [Xanthobacteraceae bacterium]
MADFTPISAAIGGALIGLAAVMLMLLNGRIAGVTGVFAGLIDPTGGDRAWRATFIAGLIAAPLSAVLLGFALPIPQMPTSLIVVAGGGLLVGFGTRLANGCTSGHGVCGIARLSPRSITATVVFMTAAIVVVALTRHVFGG